MTLFAGHEATASRVWVSTHGFGVVRADQIARLRAGLDPSCATVATTSERWGVYLAVVGHLNAEHLVANTVDLQQAEKMLTALLNTVNIAAERRRSGIVRVDAPCSVVFEPFVGDVS